LPGGWVRAAVLGLGLAAGIPASALEVHVAGPGESIPVDSLSVWSAPAQGDTLLAAFRLAHTMNGDERLGEGIPATLILVVDLWKERDGWWNSLVRSQVLVYRFQVDAWTGVVELLDQAGATLRFPDRASLQVWLERVHEIMLGTPRDFEKERAYYVNVKALLRPMKLEDLEEVDAWLSGRVTGGGKGGVLGVPKAVARVLFGASGLGDKNATGRSGVFVPRP